MTNADVPLESIPIGAKSDVYFVVQYESDKRVDIPDDCGAWDSSSGTTVNQLFTVSSENKRKMYFSRTDKSAQRKLLIRKLRMYQWSLNQRIS
ncbi:hypothetical protein DPMN_059511 [Dreissena polymorpha]|uniref:Uncharacterized protein n=1 Tax=Dreissena polymorpha TaxID=45954 RepID=A0A9D4C451_DREPO|nr:hypothetical protein DPMN_059511 [Dreissena polymorpha]